MTDDTTTTPNEGQGQGGRNGGGRGPGNREPGGFRIRLSDNEMRAVRAVQEAFRLRSTVAALGFSIRTIAQLLEDGQLDELVAQQRAQAGNRGHDSRGDGPRGGRRHEARGEGRGERRADRGPRIDPFARPAKPTPAPAAEAEEEAAVEPVLAAVEPVIDEAPAETSDAASEA